MGKLTTNQPNLIRCRAHPASSSCPASAPRETPRQRQRRVRSSRGWRHALVKPAARHRAGAVGQVADRVGEVVVHQIAEALLLEVAVVAEGDIAQQIPTHRIAAAALKQIRRIEHIAQGFAHLLALTGEEAMAKHLGRQGQPGRQQHRRPIHGVEAQDVLTDHMHGGGPAAA